MGTPEFTWKPWGFEEMFWCGEYTVKLLHVRAGQRLELEQHIARTETFMVHRGLAQILIGDESRLYRPGEVIHIPAGVQHRVAAGAHGDLELFEVSTPEVDEIEHVDEDDRPLAAGIARLVPRERPHMILDFVRRTA
jgi:mannose-6-phosphate isomerase-like protein (cupin superfamily)